MSAAGNVDVRAVRKAWKALSLETRSEVFRATKGGERPDIDDSSWETVRTWAALYPGRSVPGVLLSCGLLILALGFPAIWAEFTWVIVVWAIVTLLAALQINLATARIRRVAGAAADRAAHVETGGIAAPSGPVEPSDAAGM